MKKNCVCCLILFNYKKTKKKVAPKVDTPVKEMMSPKIKGQIEEIKEEVEEENKVSMDLTHDSNQHLFNIQKFIG